MPSDYTSSLPIPWLQKYEKSQFIVVSHRLNSCGRGILRIEEFENELILSANTNIFHSAFPIQGNDGKNHQMSASPTTSNPMLTTAFTLKNAMFIRVKSAGVTSECS